MKISYDAEIDALYIRLIEGKHPCRTARLSKEAALNIGEGEKLVGISVSAPITLGSCTALTSLTARAPLVFCVTKRNGTDLMQVCWRW